MTQRTSVPRQTIHAAYRSRRARIASSAGSRGGFSLLEVLIAMFVLTIGMLGIAATIPIANLALARMAVADRAAACGRAAQREVRVRDMLDPSRWLTPDFNPVVPPGTNQLPTAGSYCIDPLYIARAMAQTQAQGGDMVAAANRLKFFPYDSAASVTMQRVTLAESTSADPAAHASLFDRIFTWRDDLVVDRSGEARPRLLFLTNQRTSAAFPFRAGDSPSGDPVALSAYGNYSWMVTVTPAWRPRVARVEDQKYHVSVVVFRQRQWTLPDDPDVDAPGERVVTVNFLGSGTAGGDVRLTTTQGFEYLDISENRWMLLCGKALPARGVFHWYRVIAAGETYSDGTLYARELTLAGPDWNLAWNLSTSDNDGDGVAQETQGVLMTNVVGVYTETVEPDVLAPWSFRP